jgi:hypothetical protein
MWLLHVLFLRLGIIPKAIGGKVIPYDVPLEFNCFITIFKLHRSTTRVHAFPDSIAPGSSPAAKRVNKAMRDWINFYRTRPDPKNYPELEVFR